MCGTGHASLIAQGLAATGTFVVAIASTAATIFQRRPATVTILTTAPIPSGYAAAYSSNREFKDNCVEFVKSSFHNFM